MNPESILPTAAGLEKLLTQINAFAGSGSVGESPTQIGTQHLFQRTVDRVLDSRRAEHTLGLGQPFLVDLQRRASHPSRLA